MLSAPDGQVIAQATPGQESELAAAQDMQRNAISEAIMQHLARHPPAKDSVRGVVEWCRAAMGVVPDEDMVQDVLEELERQARIASSVLVDGTRVYHRPASP